MNHIFKYNKDDDIPEVALTVSNRTLFRVVIVVLVTLALITAFLKVSHSVILIFISFFLALALNAPVAKVAKLVPGRKRGSRSIATTLSFLLVIILLGLFASYIIPPLVLQTEKFVAAAPSLIRSAQNQDSSLGHFIRSHNLQGFVKTLSNQISQRFKGFGRNAFSSVAGVAVSIFSLIAVLVMTFMMLVEGPRWVKAMREIIVPEKKIVMIDRVASNMYEVIKGYVNGQVFLALIAALAIAPALFLLHVNYPVALMVIIFLAGLIPMIGHTIGAIIVSVVALFHSLPAAIILLLYYILYMQVENYLLQPKIQANTTNMSPLLVFVSIVIGVNFGGLLGGLVAIPVTACVKVIVLEYLAYKKLLPKNLEDQISKDLKF
jgi:predicted PurR-regulated permease PerM